MWCSSMMFQPSTCVSRAASSSPLSGGTPPRQGTHVLAARSDIVEVILPLVRETLRPLHCRPSVLSRHRKWVVVASDPRRSSLDGRILGCSGYPMQTALTFLVVLLGTLAV